MYCQFATLPTGHVSDAHISHLGTAIVACSTILQPCLLLLSCSSRFNCRPAQATRPGLHDTHVRHADSAALLLEYFF
ncbi:hypothetical protein SEVIR_5G387550v4 [Setaria viridis]